MFYGLLRGPQKADKVLHGVSRDEPLNWVLRGRHLHQETGRIAGLGCKRVDQLPLKGWMGRDVSDKEQVHVTCWLPFPFLCFRTRNLLSLRAIRNHRPIQRKPSLNRGASPRAKRPRWKDAFLGLGEQPWGKCDAGVRSQGHMHAEHELYKRSHDPKARSHS